MFLSGKSVGVFEFQSGKLILCFCVSVREVNFVCVLQWGKSVLRVCYSEAGQFKDDLDITNSTYYKRAMFSTDYMFTTGKAVSNMFTTGKTVTYLWQVKQ